MEVGNDRILDKSPPQNGEIEFGRATAVLSPSASSATSLTGWRPAILAGCCCFFSALGSFLFGYDTGIISSAIAQPDFNAHLGGGQLSDAATGGVVSSFTAGAFVGTAFVSFISDRLGRRIAIFIGAILACIGGAMQGGADTLATMVVGRIFAGLGIGVMSATIPNYCAEIAPPRIRGMLGGMQQWMIGLGIVSAQWVGYGSSTASGPLTWRLPLSLQIAPALLLACGVFFLPESPRNLAERGDILEAYRVLERLHLRPDGSNRQLVDLELQQIEEMINTERSTTASTSWKILWLDPALRRRVLLSCGIQLFTQTSGTNVIGYYGPRIYASLGYSVTGSLFIVGLYGALAQVFNTICMAFVDKIGRRKLLIPSMVGMGASLCVEATLTKYFNPATTTDTDALRASVAMNFVFALFFTSLGVISWIYPSEIFPTAMRAKGTSLSTCTNWSVNLIFAQCTPLALTRMGYRYFYFFTAFNWVAAAVVYFYYPETLGKSLEEVHEIFGDFHINRRVGKQLGNATIVEPAWPEPLKQKESHEATTNATKHAIP